MQNCLFCKIAAGQTPAKVLYQDELVTAFHDIHPVAPTHFLVIPNKHINSTNELEPADAELMGHMFLVAKNLAHQEGISFGGYRSIINTGSDGGQTVNHLHLHIIGGKALRFPMA